MDKYQIDLLEEIYKVDFFDFSNVSEDKKEILNYLSHNRFIRTKANMKGDKKIYYVITELGKTALDCEKKQKIKTWLPIIISLVSLVVSIFHIVLNALGII